jgi:phosphoenolpyruvate carboxykinase (ATP)
MSMHNSRAYLVNTGWIGGPYGVGKRIDIPVTRAIIDAILNDTIENSELEILPIFGLAIPKTLPGVDDRLLNPRNLWADPNEWDKQARMLAQKFIDNFENFTDNDAGKLLRAAGPQL